MALRKLLNQKIDNYYPSISYLNDYQIEKFVLYCADNYQYKNYSFNINYKNKNNPSFFPFLFLLTKKEKKDNQTALKNNKKHTITFNGKRFKETCNKMIKINTQLSLILNFNNRKFSKKDLKKIITNIRKDIKNGENILNELRITNEDEEVYRETEFMLSLLKKELNKLIKEYNKNNETKDIPFVYDFIPPIENLKKIEKNKTINKSFISKNLLKSYNVKNKIGIYHLFPVFIDKNELKKIYKFGINILRNKTNKYFYVLASPFKIDNEYDQLVYFYLTKSQINKLNKVKQTHYNFLDNRKSTRLLKISATQVRKTFLKVFEFNNKLARDRSLKMTRKEIKRERDEPKTRNLIEFTDPSDDLIDFTGPEDLIYYGQPIRKKEKQATPRTKTNTRNLIEFTDPSDDLIDFS